MRVIRQNMFETNSSSEHSLGIASWKPIDILSRISSDYGQHDREDIKRYVNKETKTFEIPKIPDLDYGKILDFSNKLIYVFYLLVIGNHGSMLNWGGADYNGDGFTATSANKILSKYYKKFINRITKFIRDEYGIDCTDIKFKMNKKDRRNCYSGLDHGVLYDCGFDDNNGDPIGLHGMSLFDILTNDGLYFDYQFC